MAQAPATPKARRAAHLLRAAFRGISPGSPGLAPSESAALKLRRARAGESWLPPKTVTFLIPLVGPESVGNWSAVTALLERTLNSLLLQTDPNWRAIICCQTQPPLPLSDKITFLPFEDPTPGNDKWRKLAALYGHLAHNADAPGLVMTFDADDRADPTLVHRLLEHPGGALLERGYVYDAGHDRIALARPQTMFAPGAKAFWKLCGSCAALPFDPGQASRAAQWAFLSELSQHEHRMVPYLARLAGQPLHAIAVPLALYMLNHGENFGARRGRVTFKTRFAERFALTDPAVEASVRKFYGL
ncbi:glycosyltransferase family A protein [Primorskyibacter sp. S187A]|uniref:glycosyltransferase family A protein n=1 Tax=Primorskyibacter sp. S187A TaxID=3415130 RepID=UPI003C7D7548